MLLIYICFYNIYTCMEDIFKPFLSRQSKNIIIIYQKVFTINSIGKDGISNNKMPRNKIECVNNIFMQQHLQSTLTFFC